MLFKKLESFMILFCSVVLLFPGSGKASLVFTTEAGIETDTFTLDFGDNAQADIDLEFGASSGVKISFDTVDDNFLITPDGSGKGLYIDTESRVSIGDVTDPQANLHIKASSDIDAPGLYIDKKQNWGGETGIVVEMDGEGDNNNDGLQNPFSEDILIDLRANTSATAVTPADWKFRVWGDGRTNVKKELTIGDQVPGDGSGSGGQELKIDANGAIGGDFYCDSNGLNCTAAADLGGTDTDDQKLSYSAATQELEIQDGNKVVLSFGNLTDVDGDTKIELEKAADDDTIRLQTDGVERVAIDEFGNVRYKSDGVSDALILNKGKGGVGAGSDILMTAQGLIAAESNMIFNIDSDNDTDASLFYFKKDTETSEGQTLATLDEDGDLDVSHHTAIGPNATNTDLQTLTLADNYNEDANTFQLRSSVTVTSPVLTGTRTSYNGFFDLVNNKTEDLVGNKHSEATGLYSRVRNTGSETFRTMRGVHATAYNDSDAASDLGTLYGLQAEAYQNDTTSSLAAAYGVNSTARGRSASTGSITNLRAFNGSALSYGNDITNAYGAYNYAATTNGQDGSIANAYGTRGRVYSASDDGGDITNAYGGYFDIAKLATANNMNTARGVYATVSGANTAYGLQVSNTSTSNLNNYGIHITARNGTTNNYGIYGVEGDWVLDADGDGIVGGTGPGGDFFLGESQDLKLYHDTADSFILNKTGDLYISDTGNDDVILSYNGGKVGINQLDPQFQLHATEEGDGIVALFETSAPSGTDTGIAIKGARNGTTNVDTAYVDLQNFDSNEGAGTEYSMGRLAAGMEDADGQTGRLRFSVNDGTGLQTAMVINSDGNVGIGVDDPVGRIQTVGSDELPGLYLTGEDNIWFDNGQVRITTHDGQGNWQIKTGADNDDNYAGIADGAIKFRMSENGRLDIHSAPAGVVGDPITWTLGFNQDADGNVGLGTASTGEKLDINGAIKLRNTASACGVISAGVIRYNAGVFQGCNGTAWVNF